MNGRRRALLRAAGLSPLASPLAARATTGKVDYPAVTPRPLAFPRDHGAHPEYRIEWWYLTGHLDNAGTPLGLQVTFFRARSDIDPANPSRFAAQQLVIAHVALADPARGSLLIDERIARGGFGDARASEADTDVVLGRWRFRRQTDGAYLCEAPAHGFDLRFTAMPTQPLLLQGDAGFSRKGPDPAQASYYYSFPHLAVEAVIRRDDRTQRLRGHAWLDHEWSSTVLDPRAAGWDWAGINLDGGGALTAFDIRPRGGGAPLWAYAALREPSGRVQTFAPHEVRFEPLEHWTSPRTRARWPVAQRITVGRRAFDTQPLFADQELDSRATSGAVYWEGASLVTEGGRRAGAGYLEMTGYLAPIVL